MRHGVKTTLVVTLLAVVVAGPSFLSADAARADVVPAPPPPVAEVPALPSQTVKMMQGATGTWADARAAQVLKGMLGWRSKDLAVIPNTVKTLVEVPKPITAAAPLARGAAASGSLLTGGFMVGWAIGKGGLAAYGAMTGTDFDAAICNADQWVQVANMIANLGMGPDCVSPVFEANSDVTTGTILSYGGSSYRLIGYVRFNKPGVSDGVCLYGVGGQPSGAAYQQFANGVWTTVTAPSSYVPSGCGSGTNRSSNVASGGSWLARWVSSTTGAVLATVVQTSANPTRTPDCTITWPGGATSTGTGTKYTETDGVPVSADGLGCGKAYEDYVSAPGHGPGLIPDKITVGSTDEETGARTVISDQPVPDFDATQEKALDPTVGNGHGLVLQKVVGTTVQTCMTWATDCSGWWASSSNGTVEDTYKCTYAGEAVSLTECGVYRNTFDTKTDTPTITDPATGEQSDWASDPDPANSTDPGVAADSPGKVCMDEWPSEPNPLAWVLHPVKCALVYAFAPRPLVVQASVKSMQDKWARTMPGRLPAVVGPLFTVPAMSGCEGPHVYIPFHDVNPSWPNFDAHPLSACEPPMSTVAATANALGAAILAFLTGLGIIRRISAVVNAPGVGGGPS